METVKDRKAHHREPNREFMNVLKQHRVAKGLTCEQLAGRLNVSTATVSNWETGRWLPRPKTYPRLARLLGLSPLRLAQIIEPSELHPGEMTASATK